MEAQTQDLTRAVRLDVRVDGAERAAIRSAARKEALTPSAFVRRAAVKEAARVLATEA